MSRATASSVCVRVWIPAWCCALLPTPLCEPRSPLRGEFKYSYDWGRETWLCTTDGHLLLDLLTRDLIYCCNGFPKFQALDPFGQAGNHVFNTTQLLNTFKANRCTEQVHGGQIGHTITFGVVRTSIQGAEPPRAKMHRRHDRGTGGGSSALARPHRLMNAAEVSWREPTVGVACAGNQAAQGNTKKERFSRCTTAYSDIKRRHCSDDKLAGRGADTWHSPTMKSNRWHIRVSSISSFTARGRVLGACHMHDGRRDIAAKCRRAIEPGDQCDRKPSTSGVQR